MMGATLSLIDNRNSNDMPNEFSESSWDALYHIVDDIRGQDSWSAALTLLSSKLVPTDTIFDDELELKVELAELEEEIDEWVADALVQEDTSYVPKSWGSATIEVDSEASVDNQRHDIEPEAVEVVPKEASIPLVEAEPLTLINIKLRP